MAGTGGERNAAGRAYAPPATACPPAPPPELSTWKVLLLAVAAVVAAFSGLPGTDDDDERRTHSVEQGCRAVQSLAVRLSIGARPSRSDPLARSSVQRGVLGAAASRAEQ